MKRIFVLGVVVGLVALGCGKEPDPLDTSKALFTDGGSFFVAWDAMMHPSTDHTDMTIDFEVNADDQTTLLTSSTITADARTTQHGGHGMPTGAPTVTANGDGTFSATPYNFPHGGHWIFEVEVTDNGTTEAVEFNVIVEGETEGEHEH